MIKKSDLKWFSLATIAMDGGSAGFAGAKTGRFLFSGGFKGDPSKASEKLGWILKSLSMNE
ncbi:MAG: hypothetical protein ACU83U_07925 [Gammaproteobacteria bacterium]